MRKRRLELGPFIWTVYWVTHAQLNKLNGTENKDIYGLTFARELKIYISVSMDPEIQKETLLHELMHAAASVQVYDGSGGEEGFITIVSPMLYQAIRRNRWLREYLLGENC